MSLSAIVSQERAKVRDEMERKMEDENRQLDMRMQSAVARETDNIDDKERRFTVNDDSLLRNDADPGNNTNLSRFRYCLEA